MPFQVSSSPLGPLLALAAGLALVACGGGDDAPQTPGTQTLEQRSQALAASGAEGQARALSPAAQAEVQTRSREWAVAAITDPALPTGSVMTVPPLYFGLAFAVDAASAGETRAALRQIVPPATFAVQAALQRGLKRGISASSASEFNLPFLDAVTASRSAGTWAQLTIQPLTPQQVAGDPNLRLAISDRAGGSTWAWPQAQAYEGVHQFANGNRIAVPMLRVQGPVLEQAGAGYQASSMAMGNGHWLVRIVPQATPAAFGSAGLSAALAAVVPTLTAQAVAAASNGAWLVPVTSTSQSAGLGDRRGMTLAMDEVNADLRGMDGGGSYLKAPPGGGSLGIDASGFTYGASQSMEFIFSPLNMFGPGYQSVGVIYTRVDLSQPPCPTEPADVRPYFLALVQPGGNIELLARMDSYGSSACGSGPQFILLPPVGP